MLLAERAIPHPVDSEAGRNALLDIIGDCSFVLLGEASHGTHEFYATRARITRQLIEERGFDAVVVEADWPDAYRVNRWVRGAGDDGDANSALLSFRRFPTWMWRNTDVLSFITWLREHNATQPDLRRAGFYGMDLYSLHSSIDAVLEYLDRVDPDAGQRAHQRYSCFDHFGEDTHAYGHAATLDVSKSCEEDALNQLVEMRERSDDLLGAGVSGTLTADEAFDAEQNARLVLNAERYYRSMFRSDVHSWNLRDTHMMDTLDALRARLNDVHGRPARLVVWAHNSHLGDARATELSEEGELNVGQLVRERHGDDAVLIGFTTHSGTVTAASEWDEPPQRKIVRPSLAGSYERLFHDSGVPNFLVDLRHDAELRQLLGGPLLQRAIGVIYRPDTERQSHYFRADITAQFDAVIHFDETTAVQPLDPPARWPAHEVPDTFPSGL